jgi:hypothetical protein
MIGAATEREQPTRDFTRAASGGIRGGQRAFPTLRGNVMPNESEAAADPSQQIVEIVSNAPREHAEGFRPIGLLQALSQSAELRFIAYDEQCDPDTNT